MADHRSQANFTRVRTIPDGWARPTRIGADMWFSPIPCARCFEPVGDDALPYLIGTTDEDAVFFCAPCGVRLFDIVQTWYSTTQVGA